MAVSEQTLVAGQQIDQLSINTIRTLAMDAVQAANSGHPGTPMALAPIAYTLWQQFLRYDPADPTWPNRDRFVLSNGHASMLLYALVHLAGIRGINGEFEDLGQFAIKPIVVTVFDQLPIETGGGNFQRVRKRNQIFNIEYRSYLFADQLAIAVRNAVRRVDENP